MQRQQVFAVQPNDRTTIIRISALGVLLHVVTVLCIVVVGALLSLIFAGGGILFYVGSFACFWLIGWCSVVFYVGFRAARATASTTTGFLCGIVTPLFECLFPLVLLIIGAAKANAEDLFQWMMGICLCPIMIILGGFIGALGGLQGKKAALADANALRIYLEED